MSVNKVILIGRVGQDPQVTTFDNGGKICRLSVATNESYKKKDTGEKVINTEWHNVIFNGKAADVVEKYFKKGMEIYVEGSIKKREYQDKEGVNRFSFDIQAREFTFIGSKPSSEQSTEQETLQDRGDLPF